MALAQRNVAHEAALIHFVTHEPELKSELSRVGRFLVDWTVFVHDTVLPLYRKKVGPLTGCTMTTTCWVGMQLRDRYGCVPSVEDIHAPKNADADQEANAVPDNAHSDL